MSKNKDKDQELHQLLNDYRIFPRIFALLFIALLWVSCKWFMGLEDPGAEQAGFVSTIVASSAAYFKFYVNSGHHKDTD